MLRFQRIRWYVLHRLNPRVEYVAALTLLVAVLLVVPAVVNSFWPQAGLILYGVCTLVPVLLITAGRVLLIHSVGLLAGVVIDKDKAGGMLVQLINLMVVGGVLLMTFVVCGSEVMRLASLHFGGFAARGTDDWYWVRYGLSWILDNGLANLSQIYGWNLSDVQATAAWSQSLVWAFNILLNYLILATLAHGLNVARGYYIRVLA